MSYVSSMRTRKKQDKQGIIFAMSWSIAWVSIYLKYSFSIQKNGK